MEYISTYNYSYIVIIVWLFYCPWVQSSRFLIMLDCLDWWQTSKCFPLKPANVSLPYTSACLDKSWEIGHTLDNLYITCNFLYCNYQVNGDFLKTSILTVEDRKYKLRLITVKPRYNVTSFIAHTTLWIETTSLTLSRSSAANCSAKC
jgi:hypothetical protein